MGYIAHHAVLVSSWNPEHINVAHRKAVTMFPENNVTSIAKSGHNGYESFMIGPDGSKEGWPQSDEGDDRRERYTNWLDEEYWLNSLYCDWVEVRFGGDDSYEAEVTRKPT